jgi:hypothetical protein
MKSMPLEEGSPKKCLGRFQNQMIAAVSSLISEFRCAIAPAQYVRTTGQLPLVRVHHGEAVGRSYSGRRLCFLMGQH